jgi:two-component system OmpR family response regulator
MTTPARKVLLVDDDPHIRQLLAFAFGKAGMATIEAGNGEEALARITAEAPDLLVLDINMPRMDGLEVCRRLRGMDSAVPILFLSSRDDEIDRVLGIELGADDYVVKPFSPREVVARAGAILRRSAPQPITPPSPYPAMASSGSTPRAGRPSGRGRRWR